ncbi:MAG: TldD/PmbA family protein [Planctomycetes bacterium]|nr:TldD/PmbA family protein [Planctomycetota bacterium]
MEETEVEHLAQHAVDVMKRCGVEYGDVRFVAEREQDIAVSNGDVQTLTDEQSRGFGVRVLAGGSWGFHSSCETSEAEIERVVRQACAIAAASAQVADEPVRLAAVEACRGEYTTPHQTDPFEVPLAVKLDVLIAASRKMMGDPVVLAQSFFAAYETVKVFASTEGALVRQRIVETGGGIAATAVRDGDMQVRSYPNSFRGNFATAGYEYFETMAVASHAERVRREAIELLSAPQCPSGRRTVILEGGQLALQVHESIGHPIELDRVIGMESAYAGDSFLTLDKLNTLQYGSSLVNVVADATVPGGLGTFGYDDEGVPAQRTPIITEGRFVGYMSSRETAPIIGQTSSGTMRASSWSRIPLIRMTNVNLLPQQGTLDELIADTADGLLLATNRSWSIDNKRLNFQFGTEVAWEITGGKLGRMFKNPTYTGVTPEFWNSCDAVCGPSEWRLFGTPNCGKGQPSQTAHVGHGVAPARFRNVEVGVMK